MSKPGYYIGMTEEELIQGCKKQSRRHQEALYRKYSRKVYGACLRYAASDAEAEDMMQEAFIKIFRNMEKYKPTGSFEAWIKRVSINVAIEIYRRAKKIVYIESYEEVREPSFNPQTIGKLDADQIHKLVNQLPDGYRVIFNLYAVEGYTHVEIADMLGIAEGTSKSQFSRAKAHLVKMLEEQLHIRKEDKHVRF